MPAVTVIPHILRSDTRRVVDVPVGTPLAAWAQGQYPGKAVQVFADGEAAPGAVVVPGHTYGVLVVPADPLSAALAGVFTWQTVATIAVNLAVGAIVSALFKPKKPSAANTPNASPVYNIGAAQNQARLGAPIPVIYGSVVCTPDYAAQPVTRYVDNGQFLYMLFCIGQGDHGVYDMLIGDTSASSVSPDIASWTAYPPWKHGSAIGTIETQTGVPENTFTSSEVSDQELVGPDSVPASSPIYWKNLGTNVTPEPAGATQSSIGALQTDHTSPVGTVKYSTDQIYNDGARVYYRATAVGPALTGGDIRVNDYLAGGAHKIIGAFEMCRPDQVGHTAELDFVFPSGLFKQDNSGNLQTQSVDIEIRFLPINDKGVPTGPDIVAIENFSLATMTPQRITKVYPLPLGRYSCRVRRTSLKVSDTRISERMIWAGLRFQLHNAAPYAYGDVTLVAVKIKATNGIGSGSTQRIRFRVKRKLAPLGVGTLADTVNPVDALMDIVMSKYGGNRPRNDAEFDLPELTRARALWDYHNGFNAVFDRPSTVWEAMTLSLQTVAAVPLPLGQRISLAHDAVKNDRVAMFTEHNIVADSLAVQYEFAKLSDPVAVKVEYRDPLTFLPEFVSLPTVSDTALSINLFGCTSSTVARQHAQLQLNRQQYQRKSVTFQTELEGLLVRHGDRIAVAHSLPKWGQSAEVLSVSGNVVDVNVNLDWSGAFHAIVVRDEFSRPHVVSGVTRGNAANQIVLPAAFPFIHPDDLNLEPTILAFGPVEKVVTDWVVTSVEPQGDTTVNIGAVAYNPAVYAGAMPHQLDTTVVLDSWVIAGTPAAPSTDWVISGIPANSANDFVLSGSPR